MKLTNLQVCMVNSYLFNVARQEIIKEGGYECNIPETNKNPVNFLKTTFKNLKIYKSLCTCMDIDKEIRDILFDLEFPIMLQKSIENVRQLWDFIEALPSKTLGEAVEMWLQLDCPQKEFLLYYNEARKSICTPLGLTSCYLNPDFERKLLGNADLIAINEFLWDVLSQNGISSYLKYKDNVYPFSKKKINYTEYWKLLLNAHEDLAQFALDLEQISSGSCMQWQLERDLTTSDFDTVEKLTTISFALTHN